MKTRLFIVRHAEAEGNYYRRFHGQYDSLVTENGKRQIEALRQRFETVHFDACYASDLYRTRKTAEAVWLEQQLPLQTDARLREVAAGCWEDVTFGWLERYDAENLHAFGTDPEHWHVEGSEGYASLTGRFLEAIEDIARQNAGGTVAVFTHSCVLTRAQQVLLGGERPPYCDNTAVSLLEYADGDWSIQYLNDSSHVPEEISTFARQKWWRRGGDNLDCNMRYEQTAPGHWNALLRDRVVGQAAVDVQTGEILQMEMDTDKRGVALGPQLLGQIISEMRARGARQVYGKLPAAHPAEHFMQEQGFAGTQQGAEMVWRKDIFVPQLQK